MSFEAGIANALGLGLQGFRIEFVDLRNRDMSPTLRWHRPERIWETREDACNGVLSGCGQDMAIWACEKGWSNLELRQEGLSVYGVFVDGILVSQGQVIEVWG